MKSRALLTALALAFAGILLFGLYWLFDAFQIVDDAYFYARYANRWIEEGSVAWNPGGAPDYGPTSLFQVFSLVPWLQARPDAPAFAILASSATCAVAFLALLSLLVVRSTPRGRRAAAVTFVLGALAASALEFCLVTANGMDTALATAFVTALLLAFHLLQRRPSPGLAVFVGVVAALGLGVRPDTLVFALGLPIAGWSLERDAARRRAFVVAAISCATALGAELLVAHFYFGRPLPLSFYAKGTKFYSEAMHGMFADTPRIELMRFAYTARILLLVIVADIALAPRRFWRDLAWQ